MLFNTHNRVNTKFNKYYRKRLNKRIKLYAFPQQVNNNTHAHCLIDIPEDFNREEVIEEFKTTFNKLDDRKVKQYTVFCEIADSDKGNVIYATREYKDYGDNDMDSMWVI